MQREWMMMSVTDAFAGEDLAKDLLESVYTQALSDIKSPSRHKIFISGGRGLGKSFLLSKLAQSRAKATGRESPIVAGRNWSEAPQQVAQIHTRLKEWQATKAEIGDSPGTEALGDLFVDDLDHLVFSLAARDTEAFKNFMNHLYDLVSALPVNASLCALTSVLPPSRLEELLISLREGALSTSIAIKAFSDLIMLYDNIALNPWQGDWEVNLGVQVRLHLPRLADDVQNLCRNLLVELTGGHPALLIPALSGLVALFRMSDSAAISPAGLQICIEDAVQTRGLSTLRRAISSLRDSKREEWRAAYEDLRRFAYRIIPTPPSRSREILVGEGLIYKDERSNQYIIPGETLRGELTQDSGGPLRTEIEPDSREPDKGGFLRVWDHHREKRIPLSGGSWSVVRAIFEEPARIVSLDELKARSHLTTENAVRSALQRLVTDIREAGVEDVVENLYGKGYRRGESPAWIIPA